jgi:pimeloyl-ACP methyl ester carboxylesterase
MIAKRRYIGPIAAAALLASPAAPQGEYVTTEDGVRLYYHIVGSGSPVVLVPGGLFLERDFAKLAHGRTMVFYDMRNRGRSDRVKDSTRISIGTTSAISKPCGRRSVPNASH